MKKIILIITLIFSSFCYADDTKNNIPIPNDISGIIQILLAIDGYTSSIDTTDKKIAAALTGKHNLGNLDFKDSQSYGKGAENWSNVLKSTPGSSSLEKMMQQLGKDFPINMALVKKSVSDPAIQKYYELQAQTVLAARATSQLDYNKIQEQIDYQQMLLKKIDETANIKESMDLANRIQVENNLIQLQQLRQIAINNQQQAVNTQGQLNAALLNAHFLSNPKDTIQEKSNEN